MFQCEAAFLTPVVGVKSLFRNGLNRSGMALAVLRARLAYRLRGIEAVSRQLLNCDAVYVPAILREFGATIGANTELLSPLLIHNATDDYQRLQIGAGCHVGKDVFLDLRDQVILEDYVTVSMRVTILTHLDVGRSPLRDLGWTIKQAPVCIRKGAYIGAGAIILAGVTLGECCIVGAGAVVTRDVPPNILVVGVPAKPMKRIHTDQPGEPV